MEKLLFFRAVFAYARISKMIKNLGLYFFKAVNILRIVVNRLHPSCGLSKQNRLRVKPAMTRQKIPMHICFLYPLQIIKLNIRGEIIILLRFIYLRKNI
jgi:hypothetical protein